jgi:hypothetical protein
LSLILFPCRSTLVNDFPRFRTSEIAWAVMSPATLSLPFP